MPRPPFTAIHDMDYFSGSQTFLYIGDVLVDEVTSIQYSLSQTKAPIYGYASQMFDTVAVGQVGVSGNFTVNFKEAGYLWAVLRRYFQIADSGITFGGPKSGSGKAEDRLLKNYENARVEAGGSRSQLDETRRGVLGLNKPLVGSRGSRISLASIERLLSGDANRDERYDFYQSIAGYATFDQDSPRDKAFEDLMEVFEDQVWGSSTSNEDLINQLRRADDNRFDGFDIYIVYGNYQNEMANHTVRKIVGAHITGQAQMVQIDGQPLQEQYTFLAQTIV